MRNWILLSVSFLISCGEVTQDLQRNYVPVAHLTIEGGVQYKWPQTVVGLSRIAIFKITNLGELAATQLEGRFLVSAFNYTAGAFPGVRGTCGALLLPGQSCEIEVEFTPNYTAVFTEPIRITYFNGAEVASTFIPELYGVGTQNVGP